MQLEHLRDVLEIEKFSFPTPWSYQAFAYELLHNDFAHYIVAQKEQQVVGYAGIWVVIDEAHITNVAVKPDNRNNKIGHLLIEHLISEAVRLGANKITLEVRPSNTYARRLYKSLGFEEYGLRKNYYSDTKEDAIIMWLKGLKRVIK
ncbi:MAG: ribosomal-protein-alanine N-acetyltransferase [Firmicutes bacterium]|nr:ribosomal-protein-alanine N-acetyltransferase [Bacillota bacterium]